LSAQEIVLPKKIEEEMTMLRGFRDLVAERTGYFFGAKMLNKTMNEKTEVERTAVRETSKQIREAISTLIETPSKENASTVLTAQKANKDAKEVNSKVRKPHMKKINPLRKAVRYMDTVAIPDGLKELGVKTTELARFSLSKWVAQALETKKK